MQHAGRTEGYDPATERLTLSEVRRKILEQSNVFGEEDVIPVPCHPDCLAMAYALKIDGQVMPLTRLIDPAMLLSGEGSTIVYEHNPELRERIFQTFSLHHSPEAPAGGGVGSDLLCCLRYADRSAGGGGGDWVF